MVEMGINMYILVGMASRINNENTAWLKTPVSSQIGTIRLAGRLGNNPGIDPLSMRVLEKYALIYIEQGEGYFCDGDDLERTFQAGDAFLVFPDIPHAYGPHPDTPWQHEYVVFEGPQFDLLRETKVIHPAHPVWHLEPIDYWSRRIQEIFSSSTRIGSARRLGRFASLLLDMAATHAEAQQGPQHQWLEESVQLLSNPIGQEWPAPQDVARRVGLSYENFRKRFVRTTGESPAQFQKRRRIEHACAAIYQDTHSFKELADELGFCDAFHFSKVFRQVVGESPSDFRRKARG